MKESIFPMIAFSAALFLVGPAAGCRGGGEAGPDIAAEAENPYLGLTPPGDDPVVFAPGVVSSPDFIEMGIAFSPNGREIYFSRSAGPEVSSHFSIWVCREGESGWEAPRVAGFSTHRDFAPFMMPDGRRFLFFSQDRSNPEYKGGTYVVERAGDSWGQPAFFSDAYCITSTRDGEMFSSGGDREDRNIMTFRKTDGGFTPPEAVAGGVNTDAFEAHSFVSPDGKFILFDSARPGEFENTGIYVCFRKDDGTWGEASSLGPKINGVQSMISSLSPDGKYIFFSRDHDIWWVSARVIGELRDRPRTN